MSLKSINAIKKTSHERVELPTRISAVKKTFEITGMISSIIDPPIGVSWIAKSELSAKSRPKIKIAS